MTALSAVRSTTASVVLFRLGRLHGTISEAEMKGNTSSMFCGLRHSNIYPFAGIESGGKAMVLRVSLSRQSEHDHFVVEGL